MDGVTRLAGPNGGVRTWPHPFVRSVLVCSKDRCGGSAAAHWVQWYHVVPFPSTWQQCDVLAVTLNGPVQRGSFHFLLWSRSRTHSAVGMAGFPPPDLCASSATAAWVEKTAAVACNCWKICILVKDPFILVSQNGPGIILPVCNSKGVNPVDLFTELRIENKANGSASIHFNLVCAHILANFVLMVLFILSTAPCD